MLSGRAVLSSPGRLRRKLATVNPFLHPGRVFKVEKFQGDYLRPEEVDPYLDGVKKKAPGTTLSSGL